MIEDGHVRPFIGAAFFFFLSRSLDRFEAVNFGLVPPQRNVFLSFSASNER